MSKTPPGYEQEDVIIDFKHALEESFDYPLPFLELNWHEITPWTWDDKGDSHAEEWIIEEVGVSASPDRKSIEEKVVTNTPPTIHVVELKPQSPSDPPPFPEGGWRAWSTVLGGFMVVFCTLGAIQSFGVYQDYYTRFSLSDSTPSNISWIGSVQIFILFAIGLLTGRLFDAGYFHHCVISGSLIYLFSAFMLSFSQPHHYYQNFLSQGVGMGLGMGLMFLPALTLPSHYFRARRAVAMGTVMLGSSFGAVIYPILLNHMIYGRVGFAWGIRAVAILDVCLLLGANLLMRTRLPGRRCRPYPKKILLDPSFLLYMAGTFLVFWGIFVPFFFLQLFISLHNVSLTTQAFSISIMNGASAFGRILPNLLADRFGIFNAIIPCSAVSAGLIFAMFAATTTPGAITFAVGYGFSSGGFLSLIFSASTAFAKDMSEVGARVGIISFVIGLSLLTGNPLAALLLSPPHFTWWRTFTFATVVMIAGVICLCLSRSGLAKRKGTKFV